MFHMDGTVGYQPDVDPERDAALAALMPADMQGYMRCVFLPLSSLLTLSPFHRREAATPCARADLALSIPPSLSPSPAASRPRAAPSSSSASSPPSTGSRSEEGALSLSGEESRSLSAGVEEVKEGTVRLISPRGSPLRAFYDRRLLCITIRLSMCR